jgi:membrane protein implicated in regulation of membrane protease activity
MWLPVLWLVAGVVLVGSEALSGDFVLVMLGLGALGAAGAAALGSGVGLSVAVFAGLSLLLVAGARPALKSRLRIEHATATNVQALLGSRAVVEQPVDARGGRVRIRGDLWSARAEHEQDAFAAGRTVLVVQIDGATAVVSDEPGGS